MIIFLALKACAISFPTCSDELERGEIMSTITVHPFIALTICPSNEGPGITSLGAIQHVIPSSSNLWQIASAIALSELE